jgi:hypothetical protein
MIIAAGVVKAPDISTAWREMLSSVADAPDSKATHTVSLISSPLPEDAEIRAGADALLAALDRPSVETVANTIFPTRMAATSPTVARLGERYRAAYPTLRRFPGNGKGTYFGRLVQHPDAKPEPGDQLTTLVDVLRTEARASGPMSARYEVPIVAGVDIAVPIRTPRDTSRRGFPCLSLCSFQLDYQHLHLLATYRYEYLVDKGYGNYLGLARLHHYVAAQTGLHVGKLTIVAGRAYADAPRRELAKHLELPVRRPRL